MALNIMLQGTMSNAGKSLLAAGLCRIFRQDGYRVAPFKSQNMALNSFITAAGGEMGRAQVVQAEAAGIAPDVRMNPILLKPTTDSGSQVIVNGQVVGNMGAAEYYRRKQAYRPAILEAYESLAADYDVIVIEGAGSPAEINLKQDDFVNMGMAKMVDAPVLLIGDIDRGGVFAQLYGTIALLETDERARVKGTVVNKFRGDRTILEPGLRMLEQLCGVPVAGVVPYAHVDIDDEDSLTERFSRDTVRKLLDVAVIRLPKISNFTDFSPFERYENVSLRYVDRVGALGGAGSHSAAWDKEHDCRSLLAAGERIGSGNFEGGVARNAGIWRVRRIPNAGDDYLRPGGRGSGGKNRASRHGTAGDGDRVPRSEGAAADKRRFFRCERDAGRPGRTAL